MFGSDYPDACGRPIWMILGEDEGKEIDTTAAGTYGSNQIALSSFFSFKKNKWSTNTMPDRRPLCSVPTSAGCEDD